MDKTTDLYDALMLLNNSEEYLRFLTDLCTPAELKAMTERWQVAQALNRENSYREISNKLEVSTTTVTRVARALHSTFGGYTLLLKRIKLR